MKIDFIIPNFNGAHLIEHNIGKVINAHKGYRGEIIIIDDGSTSSDYVNLEKAVKGSDAKITLLRHTINKGFSSAINTAVKHSDADYVVLLNSDVIPQQDFLTYPLESMISDTTLFGVGFLDESHEDDKVIKRGRGIGIWKRGIMQHMRGEVDSNDTFWISGGSCIIRRSYFTRLGGMDTLFNPFYWEDIDLSYRAKKAGYKIMFDNRAIVDHFHEKGSIQNNFNEMDINSTAYRNQFIFIWKNITSSHLLINHIMYLPIVLLSAIKGGDMNLIKGFFLAVMKLPAIINKRHKQRAFNKISDIEIIKNIS